MSFTEPRIRIPEIEKKNGLCYAATDDGIELPVIDVEHPSFACDDTGCETLIEGFQAPSPVRKILLGFMLRRSLLARVIRNAGGGYVSGMGTYLLKLGPENLGNGYAKKIDRAIASSPPCLSVRLRLRGVAELLSEGLEAALLDPQETVRSVVLFNIAGGPASDSLNALMRIRRRNPALLEGVRIDIRVFDAHGEGPRFGIRSLAALRREGGPLSGLDIEMRHIPYNWEDRRPLERSLAEIEPSLDILAISSEGGLFEYGSDEAIRENLRVGLRGNPVLFVGSLSKDSGKQRAMNESSGASIRFRSIEEFKTLAREGGWHIGRIRDCPLCYCLALRVGKLSS